MLYVGYKQFVFILNKIMKIKTVEEHKIEKLTNCQKICPLLSGVLDYNNE